MLTKRNSEDIWKELLKEENEITEEDVARNIELVKKGKCLDLPLILLKRPIKKKGYFKGAYKIGYMRRLGKERYLAMKCVSEYYRIKKHKLKGKIEWCLWFLYYYNQHILKERRKK